MKKILLIMSVLVLTSCGDLLSMLGFGPDCDGWGVPNLKEFVEADQKQVSSTPNKLNASTVQSDVYYQATLHNFTDKDHIDYRLSKVDAKVGDDLGLVTTGTVYVGFVRFIPKKSGTYGFWADTRAWIEVKEQKTNIKPKVPAYETYCGKDKKEDSYDTVDRYKKVVYVKLEKDEPYTVGFLRSQGKFVRFAIEKP